MPWQCQFTEVRCIEWLQTAWPDWVRVMAHFLCCSITREIWIWQQFWREWLIDRSPTALHYCWKTVLFLVQVILACPHRHSLPFTKQHPSYGDCLEVKTEYYQKLCAGLCDTMFSQQCTYMSSSYRSNRLGLSHWDSYTVHRGSGRELYYCNMVFWWDSSLILTSSWFPSVLWHCWLGHLACYLSPKWPIMCRVAR